MGSDVELSQNGISGFAGVSQTVPGNNLDQLGPDCPVVKGRRILGISERRLFGHHNSIRIRYTTPLSELTILSGTSGLVEYTHKLIVMLVAVE